MAEGEARRLQERLDTLASEKASLQLAVDLMGELSGIVGLEPLVDKTLRVLMEAIGGSNVVLWYRVGDQWDQVDILGLRRTCDELEDEQARAVVEEGRFRRVPVGGEAFERFGLHGAEGFSTWIYPLCFRDEVFGAVCLEGMALPTTAHGRHLEPFIQYVSAALYHEIASEAQLRLALHEAASVKAELRVSNQLLGLVVDNSPLAIIALDRAALVTLWSPAAERMFGWSSHEVLGRRCPVQLADSPETFDGSWLATGFSMPDTTVEGWSQRRDGMPLALQLHVAPLSEVGGRIEGIVVIAADVTWRKQAEAALTQSEERYRTIVEDIPTLLCRLRVGGEVTFANRAFADFFLLPLDRVVGRELSSLLTSEAWASLERHLDELTLEQPINDLEQRLTMRTGEIRWVRWTSRAVFDDLGLVDSFQVTGLDITEQRELERRLRHSQKVEAIGTLAGGIAHDFNNLLTAIIGYTDLAAAEVEPGSETAELLQSSLQASSRAKDLARQILTISRQGEEPERAIELHLVVSEAVQLLRSTLPTTIELRHRIDRGSGAIKADPSQMHQIVMNLGTNAFHAIDRSGGRIDVELDLVEVGLDEATALGLGPGPHLRLVFRDTGCGMAQDVVERIFDPYFTTKAPDKGTGLGLAIVQGIVSRTRGAITVESEPGQGTTFSLFFPQQEAGAQRGDTDGRSLPRGSERVLVVDDEAEVLFVASRMLEGLGYQVTSTQSSVEALELVRRDPAGFDLVITDHTMPRKTGTVLASELVRLRDDLPIILCSGHAELFNRERARRFGIRAFIAKPYNRATFAKRVREVLDQ